MPAVRIGLTDHAIQRYVERVKPQMLRRHAQAELERLVEMAGEPGPVPDWMRPKVPCQALVLSDGIALVIVSEDGRLTAATCMVRGTLSPEVRAAQKAAKRRRRAQRRAKQHAGRPAVAVPAARF